MDRPAPGHELAWLVVTLDHVLHTVARIEVQLIRLEVLLAAPSEEAAPAAPASPPGGTLV